MAIACQAVRRLGPAAAAAATTAVGRRVPMLLCRAAGTKAAKADAPGLAHPVPPPSRAAASAPQYCFERSADDAPTFADLFLPGRQAVLLAFDPDLCGAVAALSWRNPPLTAGTADALAAADAGAAAAAGTPPGSSAAPLASSDSSSNSSSDSRNGSGSGSSISNGTGSSLPELPVGLAAAGGAAVPAVPAVTTPLHGVVIELFDMPLEVWQYGSRAKRQPEAAGLIAILLRYASASGSAALSAGISGTDGARVAVPVTAPAAKRSKGSSKSGGDGGAVKPKRRRKKGEAAEEAAAAAAAEEAAAAAEEQAAADAAAQQAQQAEQTQHAEPPVVRAVVEYSTPQFASGKFAWYALGFSVGLLNGLLATAGIAYHRVPSRRWKLDMGLNKQGKEGSIALACHLMPSAAELLTRKKDHGRAEALLMAAWSLGVRMQPIGDKSATDAAEEEEEEVAEAEFEEALAAED